MKDRIDEVRVFLYALLILSYLAMPVTLVFVIAMKGWQWTNDATVTLVFPLLIYGGLIGLTYLAEAAVSVYTRREKVSAWRFLFPANKE